MRLLFLLGDPGLPAVGVAAVHDREDGDGQLLIIDAVDDTVGSAPRTVAVSQRRLQLLAHSIGAIE